MIKISEKEICLYEKPVCAQMIITDQGIQAYIGGGDLSHIGAVTILDPDGKKQTVLFSGHKEDAITEKWAETLYERFRVPVVVSAGIHFDGITGEQITEILKASGKILREMSAEIS